MRLFVYANTEDAVHIDTVRACLARLGADAGVSFSMTERDSRALYGDDRYAGDASETELVLAIGGDGTVLRAAQYAVCAHIPLAGINNGRLGYLCAVSPRVVLDEGIAFLDALRPSRRTLLSYTIDGEEHFALNDVVITKSVMGASVQMQLSADGAVLAEWRCDGVIIATPTGSSAYTLSAGGPLLLPDVPAIVVTPICPHNAAVRSMVLSDATPLTVTVTERSTRIAHVYADGQERGTITGVLTLARRSENLTLLIP